MTKKRLGSLLFWGFFIGLFYLCSVQQNNRDNEELVEKIIKKGDFDSIRLPDFGKFSVNPNRVKYLTSLKDKKNNDKKQEKS